MPFQYTMVNSVLLGPPFQLGTHRATYKPRVALVIGYFIFSLLYFIISVLACISLFFVEGITSFFDILPGLSFVVFFAFLILIPGVWFLQVLRRTHTLHLFLYDNGLIHVWKTSLQVIFWHNVQAVRHNEVVTLGSEGEKTTKHIYTISCYDGTEMVISKMRGFSKVQKIGRAIERETARYLFPTALNTYQTEQQVVFGPLTVTYEGLSHTSQMLLWSEVKKITIVDGMIRIMKHGKKESWASVGLVAVPNVEVFKRLVKHVSAENARALFSPILQQYQMGHPVVFGSLTATHEGLFHRSRQLPWTAIKMRSLKHNEISNSRLVISHRRKPFGWAAIDLDILHVEVFRMLVDYMRDKSSPKI